MFDEKITFIAAKKRKRDYWLDLWRHRELFIILAKRDISVRYKQTAIGAAWSIFRPLMTLIVTIFAFNKVAKMPTEEGVPYSIMAFSGVLIWLFFSQMFGQISNSIVGGGNLVSKVYVPRLLIPLSSVAAGLLDFMIGLVMFFILAFFYGFPIGPQVLLMPLFLIMAYGLALGLGLFFTTINVRFRDIAQIVPFVVQFGFFASPIAFSSNVSMKSTAFYSIYNLNPVVGIIDAFRWSLLAGKAPFIWESFIPSLIITTLSLILSFKFFRKMEDSFVDYL